MTVMWTTNRHAFKEWAAVCRAIASGRQTVLFRKGGIHERRGKFAVEHDEFWLFPTRFHQKETELSEDGQPFLDKRKQAEPEPRVIELAEYVSVTDVRLIEQPQGLAALRPFHIYADRVLQERFDYRRPGLFALVVRAYVRDMPHSVFDSPHFGGCRSWIDLPSEFATSGLRPVLEDSTFQCIRRNLLDALEAEAAA